MTRAGTDVNEAIFTFETAEGRGNGVLRLTPDAGDGNTLKAWTLLTALDEIKGHEEEIQRSRPQDKIDPGDFRGPNWLDLRKVAAEYVDREPAVLVVGGGQAGLSIAARLTQLQVDTLIVDHERRIGDNWRNRYHALVCTTKHTSTTCRTWFPPTWPAYIPKDKIASWFEAYVESMELNYWTATEFEGGTYNEKEGRWSVCSAAMTARSERCTRDTSSSPPELAVFRAFRIFRRYQLWRRRSALQPIRRRREVEGQKSPCRRLGQ